MSETLPALIPVLDPEAELPEDLQFEPVPRNTKRSDGFTAERQRAFIAALASCGSATTAAKSVGISVGHVYAMRNAPGAEGFSEAWDRAVQRGSRRVLDVLVDHAINGTPETIMRDGEVVAERRRFNHRSMMWVVSHAMPERFGGTDSLAKHGGTSFQLEKIKEQVRNEVAEELLQIQAEAKAEEEEAITQFMHLYGTKVAAERQYRLEGRIDLADFTLRQLTQIELVLEVGEVAYDYVKHLFDGATEGTIAEWHTPYTKAIADHRHAVWEAEPNALPRPIYHSSA